MAKSRNQGESRSGGNMLFDRLALTWRLMLDRRVEIAHKLIPPLALLYVISPLDFIPDIFLPVGVVDDIGVFLIALQAFIMMAPRDVVREHKEALLGRVAGRNEAEEEPLKEDTAPGMVIEGKYKRD